MAKSNKLEEGVLKLIYQNIDLANIGDASGLQGSSTAGNIYIALYTSDPTDADTGSEANYTSYARIPVARGVTEWSISGNVISNAIELIFPTSTGGTNTITHVATRTALTGGDLLHHGKLSTPLTISNGDIPRVLIGDFKITEN